MGSTGADLTKTNTAVAPAECRMEPVEVESNLMGDLIDSIEAHVEEGSEATLNELVDAAVAVNDCFDNDDTRALFEEYAGIICDGHYQLTQALLATFVNGVLKDSSEEIYGPYIKKRARGNEAVTSWVLIREAIRPPAQSRAYLVRHSHG